MDRAIDVDSRAPAVQRLFVRGWVSQNMHGACDHIFYTNPSQRLFFFFLFRDETFFLICKPTQHLFFLLFFIDTYFCIQIPLSTSIFIQ